MSLDTLDAILLGNMLAGKELITARYGSKGKRITGAGYGSKGSLIKKSFDSTPYLN